MRSLLLFALLTAAIAPLKLPAQWQLHDSHSTADLRGIDNVGNGIAWASGSRGTVLRTEDGGNVWQLCAKPAGGERLDFRAIQAFDKNTAIIMSIGKGDQSRIYKTTDACQTWTLLFTNPDPDGFFDGLKFEPSRNPDAPSSTRESDHQVGWLIGDPVNNSFSVFVTRDGGTHWTKQINPGLTPNPSEQGAFAASNSSLIVSGGFVAFGTGGAGGASIYSESSSPRANSNQNGSHDKWLRVDVPVGSHSESSGIFSISGRDLGRSRTISIAVGGDYQKPDDIQATAAYFDAATKHWTAATTPPHGFRSAVVYDAATKTWITVGPNGTDISTDDGHNWRPLRPDPASNDAPDADRRWNALSLPYVVGPRGRIGTLRGSALTPAK